VKESIFTSQKPSLKTVDEFSNITRNILLCNELENFSELMLIHEQKFLIFLKFLQLKKNYSLIALYLSKVWELGAEIL
jgi:hypothetical protein